MICLDELRAKIDLIDHDLLNLFLKRMETAKQIGLYKKENGLPIFDRSREREILCNLTEGVNPELQGFVKVLFTTLFEMSRSYQSSNISETSDVQRLIDNAIQSTPKEFPKSAVVACQGVEGAYSQIACDKLFSLPNIMFCDTFESVFQAVESGLCQYGILPLENSTAGSVNQVYDLMNRYNFYIARSVRLSIQHTLLAKHGILLSNVKEIFSHEQAIQQCSQFLNSLPNVKVTVCENTATAAKLAAESNRNDIAVISSKDCTELYGLSVLSYNIQNTDNNYTRFICISKKLEIYPGAHKTSVMLTLSHKPGALYQVMAKFNALNINLNKLESRPIPGRDFEFKFYFDIDSSVYSEEFKQVLSELESETAMFDYLGSYQEI
ncbi:MAG: prephenate dehydratase domain-containing protein [Bacillota bacterium]|nr:prephenate dehydratase domain-containing protein [Bacillota bacterium]